MSRLPTANYGADTNTQFQWATTDDDQFDREFDIYRMSQALELHDHSAGRGIPVARVAAGVVDAAALAALSVGTTTIQDLSITNAKLAAGAVTRDKITMPLVQPTNDMAGGFRMRETSNTYALGFYMAANGLAVFGSGTIASGIPASLILGQTGQVSVGTIQGGALFNVMQASNAVAGGLRVYNTNITFFGDFYNNASGWPVIASAGNVSMMFEPAARGAVTIGTSVAAVGKLNIYQPTGAPGAVASEGFYMNWSGNPGTYTVFIDTNNDVNLRSAGTSIMLKHSAAALHPLTHANIDLGLNGTRWGAAFVTTLTATTSIATGSATFGGAVTGITSLTMGGALSGVTTLSMGGALTGVTTINNGGSAATLGSVVSNIINPVSDGAGNLGTTSLRFSRLFLVDAVGVGMGSNPAYQIQVTLDAAGAGKPNGGSWSNSSDRRLKIQESIHDYEGGLDTVLALRPRHFHWNGNGGIPKSPKKSPYLVGFIADEVKDIAPELHHVSHLRMFPDDKEDTVIDAINDSALPYMLINAVKTLHERIAQLEQELHDRRN